ncbi:Sua5/YciO/YrdC/YwlC family protein [Streptomyces sp. NBC_01190]|uniref:Sua5/YciO/YrdC/YwlC family protein n=1 Tax=Streptomyces sp. NBC_01190 TaxID=2903767 RepID=UPI00386BF311|nr:Sua5/YciO/YrdC/YwlC family protein [Streptomyces sp. NBC_01190]
MTVISCDQAGLAGVTRALDTGEAVLLPTPSPLPYVVAGRVAERVNTAKGRPAGQAVALWVPDLAPVTPWIALAPHHLPLLRWLLVKELVTVLVPVRPSGLTPSWVAPALRDGHVLLAGPGLPALNALHAGPRPLYVSSGNRTTHPPVATAAEAAATFGPDVLVLDGDEFRDAAVRHASSTMLRFGPRAELDVVRHGIQDAPFADGETYLKDLRERLPAVEPAG